MCPKIRKYVLKVLTWKSMRFFFFIWTFSFSSGQGKVLILQHIDRYSLLGRIPVGVKIKVHYVFTLTHPFIKCWFQNMFHNFLTPCTIYRAKTGNTVSEFMHSNWITLSTIQVPNTRACFLNVWYTSLHFHSQ